MKHSFFFACLFVTGFVYGQSSTPTGFDANSNLQNAETSMFRSFDNRYEGVKGHSTVFEDFVTGNVNMKDGERVVRQELNYDAITNELIVRSRVYKRILAVRRDLVESFELISPDGDTLVFKKVTERGFCQKIYEGKSKLYLRYVKQVAKANHGGGYNANARNYDEFEDHNIFLISVNEQTLEEIKPARKAFEKRFPEKKELIDEYFKANKPDLKSTKDLRLFMEYLDKNS
jgi:hypothetical protein